MMDAAGTLESLSAVAAANNESSMSASDSEKLAHPGSDHSGAGAGQKQAARKRDKKTRVSTACIECRRRKSKCNGEIPCSGCRSKGLKCTMLFDDRRRKAVSNANVSQKASDVQALQERCRYLEGMVAASSRDDIDVDAEDAHSSVTALASNSNQPATRLDTENAQHFPLEATSSSHETVQSSSSAAVPLFDFPSNFSFQSSNLPSAQISTRIPELTQTSASATVPDQLPAYVPPAQALTEEDMLEPMSRTHLATIHTGKATPSGVDTGSLAHQLTRRDGRMTLADGGRLRWYGATSARSHSYGGLHFQHGGQKHRDLNATCRMALNRAGYSPTSIYEEYGFQQRLISLFFQWNNAFFVTVREDVFYRQWSQYRQLQDGNSHQLITPEEGQHFSLLILYAMLAAAAPMSDEAIHKSECGDAHERAGDVFAACARICLDEEIDLPQETTVQALAIMASREVMVGKDARGYAYIGMATSCALDLGLNTDVTPWLESGQVTQEQYLVRQTTWWGLFLYEKLWALYVGRPSLCRQVAVTVPMPDSIEKLNGSSMNPIEAKTRLDFTCNLIELLRITDSIVDALYSPFSQFERSRSDLHTWSQDVHNRLVAWLADLPPSLRVDLNQAPELCSSRHNIIVLHMQYHLTVINLFRPFTCDIAQQRPLYNDAFKHCVTAACTISALIERYRFKYTLRRIAVVAIHQFLTAASWHVFVIYACMLGCVPPENTPSLHHEAQRGLLTCLGGLAAIATSQIHARRSYLMVVLLMKRWGIRLNPAAASSEADFVFQHSRTASAAGNQPLSSHTSRGAAAVARPSSDIWTTSEGFATISQELFALCGDGMFDVEKLPQLNIASFNQPQTNQAHAGIAGTSTSTSTVQANSAGPWMHNTGASGSQQLQESFLQPESRQATTSAQDSLLSDDQLKLFDFGLGSFNGLLSSPTNGMNLLDWERPSLADIFDLSNFNNM